jgi:hypothetical protein
MIHVALWSALALALPPRAAQDGTAQQSKTAPVEAVAIPAYPNSTCPVMGKAISTRLYTDTKYGRIYICCKACVKDIQEDVEYAYRTAYPETVKLANATCPLTGKPVDPKEPVRVELQGREFSVVDKAAAARAVEDAQATLAKLLDPQLTDVGNARCPTTGEAAGQNVIAVIEGRIVRFANLKAIEEARKDPKKALARAIELRAEEDREREARAKDGAPAGSDPKAGG